MEKGIMTKPTLAAFTTTSVNGYVLEDEIYTQIDKLQALCAAQTLMHLSGDEGISKKHHIHHIQVTEENLQKLRGLLDQLFV